MYRTPDTNQGLGSRTSKAKMIFDCDALGKFYRGDYLQYSHILPSALFCVLSVLQEVTSIKDSYRKKAKMTTEVLNSMENVKCNEVAGAMYAFPRITVAKKAIEAAKASCPVLGPDFQSHTAGYCQ